MNKNAQCPRAQGVIFKVLVLFDQQTKRCSNFNHIKLTKAVIFTLGQLKQIFGFFISRAGGMKMSVTWFNTSVLHWNTSTTIGRIAVKCSADNHVSPDFSSGAFIILPSFIQNRLLCFHTRENPTKRGDDNYNRSASKTIFTPKSICFTIHLNMCLLTHTHTHSHTHRADPNSWEELGSIRWADTSASVCSLCRGPWWVMCEAIKAIIAQYDKINSH